MIEQNQLLPIKHVKSFYVSKTPVTTHGNATTFVQRSKNLSACCGIAAKYV